MSINGIAKPPSPGVAPAPYVTSLVFAEDPEVDTLRHVTVSFMVDTGADRTVLSLRKARQLIGIANWETVCRRRTPVKVGSVGGSQTYWEVPMQLWFWDTDAQSGFASVDRTVLVPFYSEAQDLAEQYSERQGSEPMSLLGRDVFGEMRFEFDLSKPSPVVLDHSPT